MQNSIHLKLPNNISLVLKQKAQYYIEILKAA